MTRPKGLIGEYLPKGCNFRQVFDIGIQTIEYKSHNTPSVLNWLLAYANRVLYHLALRVLCFLGLYIYVMVRRPVLSSLAYLD